MAISREEVVHLAKLSALELSNDEIERFTGDLENIIAYVDQLQEVDTQGVEPLLQVNDEMVSPLQTQTEVYGDTDALLQWVQHEVNHRNIVITNKKWLSE